MFDHKSFEIAKFEMSNLLIYPDSNTISIAGTNISNQTSKNKKLELPQITKSPGRSQSNSQKIIDYIKPLSEKIKLPEKKISYEFRNSQPLSSDSDIVKGKIIKLDIRRKEIKSQESTKESSLKPEEVITLIANQFKNEVIRIEVHIIYNFLEI